MSKKRLFIFVVLCLTFFCCSSIIFLYFKTKERLATVLRNSETTQTADSQNQQLIFKLKKHILLPNEEPVIATVINKTLVATQSAFYKDVQNGDELVAFPNAKKAILYRPSQDLIVATGPLLLEDIATPSTQIQPGR
jgi:Na+/melibiose symporter-like transporter